MKRFVFLLVLLVLCVGCVPATPPPSAVGVTYEPAGITRPDLMARVVEALESTGYTVSNIDGATGIVTTDWKMGVLDGSKFTVSIQDAPPVVRVRKSIGDARTGYPVGIPADDAVLAAIQRRVGGVVVMGDPVMPEPKH